MDELKFNLDDLEKYTQTLGSQSEGVTQVGQALGEKGVGPMKMYGAPGVIAQPILAAGAKSANRTIGELGGLIKSMSDGMRDTTGAYRQTEEDHQDRAAQIGKALNAIGDGQ